MRINKKGIEFSVGIIVLLIFSILIFSMSVYLLFKWFDDVDAVSAEIGKQTQNEIMNALSVGNRLIAIPFPIQAVKRGEAATFGVGIRNPTASKEFSMQVSFSGAFFPDGKRNTKVEGSYVAQKWLGSFAQVEPFLLQKNQKKIIPLLIRADVNVAPGVATQVGDYAFNVCVYPTAAPSAPCTIEAYQQSVSAFYSGKLYQVVVRVS